MRKICMWAHYDLELRYYGYESDLLMYITECRCSRSKEYATSLVPRIWILEFRNIVEGSVKARPFTGGRSAEASRAGRCKAGSAARCTISTSPGSDWPATA